MEECKCTECSWRGSFSELLSDFSEDSDGDLVGEYMNACPECHAPTVDIHEGDDEDMGDERSD